jgi:hypothetical protein
MASYASAIDGRDDFYNRPNEWRAVVDPEVTSFARARTNLDRAPLVSGESGVFDSPNFDSDVYSLSQVLNPVNRAREAGAASAGIVGNNQLQMYADRERGMRQIRDADRRRRMAEANAKREAASSWLNLGAKLGGDLWQNLEMDEDLEFTPEDGPYEDKQRYGMAGIVQSLEETGGPKDQAFAQVLRDLFG